MKLWHELPTPRLAQQQKETLEFLERRKVSHQRQQICYFDLEGLAEMPAVQAELADLGLLDHMVSMAVHVLPPGRPQAIHIDTIVAHKYSYNIPVLNCEQSSVIYYESTQPLRPVLNMAHTMAPNQARSITYFDFDPETCREIDRFTMTQPTIICTGVPHNVLVDPPLLRIALLCRIGMTADLSQYGLDNRWNKD